MNKYEFLCVGWVGGFYIEVQIPYNGTNVGNSQDFFFSGESRTREVTKVSRPFHDVLLQLEKRGLNYPQMT